MKKSPETRARSEGEGVIGNLPSKEDLEAAIKNIVAEYLSRETGEPVDPKDLTAAEAARIAREKMGYGGPS